MTRFARAGPAYKKKANDASTWSELKPQSSKSSISKKQSAESNSSGPAIRKLPNGQYLFKSGRLEKVFSTEQQLLQWKKRRRTEQRRQNRKTVRLEELTCYNCREIGHRLVDCPQLNKDTKQSVSESKSNLCFFCGSHDHTLSRCSRIPKDSKLGKGGVRLPYATCFICGQTGHLSRQCSDNPRGLYPNGGSCRQCGSVDHFQRDCPDKKTEEKPILHLPSVSATATSADADVELTSFSGLSTSTEKKVVTSSRKTKKPKIVVI